ncbi:MAG: response regulator transcription factor [Aeromicrobium sp.]|uniref:response regulator n=1 Tax=Aeromicrobium sp. TaxID=1871063 RepID=UPI0039E52D0C
MRVLVVDDDPRLRRTLEILLRSHRYRVRLAATGEQALTCATEDLPHVVVLDLGLPDGDGLAVIERLRSWAETPILVLSGRSDSADKVDALDAGADDYVTKPFSADELLARLRALTRRVPADEDPPVVSFGAVTVDLAARRVTRDGVDLRLTPTEWQLLEIFVRRPGVLMSRQHLLREAWGPGYEDADGNLRLYVAQLRRKLEADPARPRHLLNEPGLGYRFDPG